MKSWHLTSTRPFHCMKVWNSHMCFPTAAFHTPAPGDGTARKIPDLTPVVFPQFAPQTQEHLPSSSRAHRSLVPFLQTIQRPADIKLEHFEALGLHVISNAPPQDIIPDSGYLPPVEQWISIGADDLEAATIASKKPLSNGNLSPGIQTYLERRNELSIDNTAAFRTIRRIPAPTGEAAVRLGNAYEFFKNLELLSGYWLDTSLPPKSEGDSSDATNKEREEEEAKPPHLRTHQRTGTGSQLPPEYRQHLLTAFIKLVAYDFGCNVSFPRVEPRLHLTSPKASTPSSYFNSSPTFIYRTPIDRASARSGIVEGPIAVVSCRTTTVFASPVDERLDLAREVVGALLTAQQRAREHKSERKFGEGQWWTMKPRWGGGSGGAIGREADKSSPTDGEVPTKLLVGGGEGKLDIAVKEASQEVAERIGDVKRAIGGINGPSPSKKPKKAPKDGAGKGNMAIYENYRKLLPPSSNWDRKARYSTIGKVPNVGYDDIFLVSALNHHVAIVRVRVPEKLLRVLDGEGGDEGWERVEMWRSKWYDLFLRDERIEAMGLVWGMMGWLMRATPEEPKKADESVEGGNEMDVS